MSYRLCYKSKNKGFSLLEVLVTLMITGVIGGICLKTISSTIKVKSKLEEKFSLMDQISHLWTLLEVDCTHAYSTDILSLIDRHNPRYYPQSIPSFEGRSLSLVRFQSPYYTRPAIIRVEYLWDGQKLIRSTHSIDWTQEETKNIVMTGISKISFEGYYQKEKKWQALPINAQKQPSALRVLLEINGTSYERLFPLLIP